MSFARAHSRDREPEHPTQVEMTRASSKKLEEIGERAPASGFESLLPASGQSSSDQTTTTARLTTTASSGDLSSPNRSPAGGASHTASAATLVVPDSGDSHVNRQGAAADAGSGRVGIDPRCCSRAQEAATEEELDTTAAQSDRALGEISELPTTLPGAAAPARVMPTAYFSSAEAVDVDKSPPSSSVVQRFQSSLPGVPGMHSSSGASSTISEGSSPSLEQQRRRQLSLSADTPQVPEGPSPAEPLDPPDVAASEEASIGSGRAAAAAAGGSSDRSGRVRVLCRFRCAYKSTSLQSLGLPVAIRNKPALVSRVDVIAAVASFFSLWLCYYTDEGCVRERLLCVVAFQSRV